MALVPDAEPIGRAAYGWLYPALHFVVGDGLPLLGPDTAAPKLAVQGAEGAIERFFKPKTAPDVLGDAPHPVTRDADLRVDDAPKKPRALPEVPIKTGVAVGAAAAGAIGGYEIGSAIKDAIKDPNPNPTLLGLGGLVVVGVLGYALLTSDKKGAKT